MVKNIIDDGAKIMTTYTYQRISFIPSVSRPMYRCGATGVLNLAIALGRGGEGLVA